MISPNSKYYCCENISHIENYDLAINDTKIKWICHHRREISENKTAQQLKNENLYLRVPASDLIFLTPQQHSLIHRPYNRGFKGGHHTYQAKLKIGEASKKRKPRLLKEVWQKSDEVLKYHKLGLSDRKIAKLFNCSRTVIRNIINSL